MRWNESFLKFHRLVLPFSLSAFDVVLHFYQDKNVLLLHFYQDKNVVCLHFYQYMVALFLSIVYLCACSNVIMIWIEIS